MATKFRHVIVLSISMFVTLDILIGMTDVAHVAHVSDLGDGGETKDPRPKTSESEPTGRTRSVATGTEDLAVDLARLTILEASAPMISDPLLRLAHHIDRAGAEDLAAVTKLVDAGINDQYVRRLLTADEKSVLITPFLHAQEKYLTDKDCSLGQRAILRKMLAVLAGVAPDSKARINIIEPHNRLCFAVKQSDVRHVQFLVDNKICDPHGRDAAGTNVVFLAQTPGMARYLVEICKVFPMYKGKQHAIRHDKFSVVRKGREWVVKSITEEKEAGVEDDE